MTTNIKFLIVIVVLGVAAIGYFLFQTPSQTQPSGIDPIGISPIELQVPPPLTDNTPQQETSTVNESVKQSATVAVTYTDQGFSPTSVSIQKGETVTFVNQSSKAMWISSGVHPTHEVYSGTTLAQHCPDADNLTFDECEGTPSGQSWIFTFTKSGSWGYHNHLLARDKGMVTVQ